MPSYVERYTEIVMKVILLMVNIDSLQPLLRECSSLSPLFTIKKASDLIMLSTLFAAEILFYLLQQTTFENIDKYERYTQLK